MSILEKAFLGSLMKAEYLLKDTVVQPEHLESTRHKDLMRRMLELNRAGKNVDLISLTTLPDFDSFGGMSYLSELLSFAEPEKFEGMEKLILDQWKEREKRYILTLAALNDCEIARVITELDKIIQTKLADHTSLQQALSNIFEAPWEDQVTMKSVTPGIKELDKVTGGFQDGEVTILAARPSMGKNDVMLHFAKMAVGQGYCHSYFPWKCLNS